MTHHVDVGLFPTKKALISAVKSVPGGVFLKDPSFVSPRDLRADEIKEGEHVYCTNHPRRSWFASIYRKNGELKVN